MDYYRKVKNNTGMRIRISDVSGRVRVHDSDVGITDNPHSREVVIEEFFAEGTAKFMEHISKEDTELYGAGTGVVLTTIVKLDLIREVTKGVYIRELDLHITKSEGQVYRGHPKFNTTIRGTQPANAVGTMIELLDPRSRYTTMYANISGEVYLVHPTRYPTPEVEGVRITCHNGNNHAPDTHTSDVKEFTTGDGVNGIRLYRDIEEARVDARGDKAVAVNESIATANKLIAEKNAEFAKREQSIAAAKLADSREADLTKEAIKRDRSALEVREQNILNKLHEQESREKDRRAAAEATFIKQQEAIDEKRKAELDKRLKELRATADTHIRDLTSRIKTLEGNIVTLKAQHARDLVEARKTAKEAAAKEEAQRSADRIEREQAKRKSAEEKEHTAKESSRSVASASNKEGWGTMTKVLTFGVAALGLWRVLA